MLKPSSGVSIRPDQSQRHRRSGSLRDGGQVREEAGEAEEGERRRWSHCRERDAGAFSRVTAWSILSQRTAPFCSIYT